MKCRCSATVTGLTVTLVMAVGIIVWLGAQHLIAARAGPPVYAPEDAEWLLSDEARALVSSAYDGLGEDAAVQDYWVSILSLGQRPAGANENRKIGRAHV